MERGGGLVTSYLAGALEGGGLPATWIDIRPLMLTDDRHGRATPYLQALSGRVRECLPPLTAAGRIPITQGFIGATADGVPTTLGRGGSDFTAALLGAALEAERVEIWTDVNGLMTADPRIVPSARTLRAASYEEAAELATFGARVLHPATALPLVRAGIPIVVLNSTHPDDPGTIRAVVDWEMCTIGDPLLDLAASLALTHHERVDGTGYPNRLGGDEIPIEGRIAAIADVFDAVSSDRVYRPAFTPEDARSLLLAGRGRHFDEDLLDLFLGAWDEVLAICSRSA